VSNEILPSENQDARSQFMWSVGFTGILVLVLSLFQLEGSQLDLRFFILAAITLTGSSTIVIQIPRFNAKITVGDTFIFLALLLFGGAAATFLAALEGLCLSYRNYRKVRTLLFNAALLAISTCITSNAVEMIFGRIEYIYRLPTSQFLAAIGLMGLVQYISNSGLAAVSSALQINKPLWPTWKMFYLWTSLTYFAASAAAGGITLLIVRHGFFTVIVAIPIIATLYFTYRIYLQNLEISNLKAERAQNYVEELSRYIDERKKAEEERDRVLVREQEARREAEKANRIKDEFLATLSHELRTPMTSIVGWVGLLASGKIVPDQYSHAINVIQRNSRVQLQLINDMLDVSRIISGKFAIEKTPVPIRSIVESAIESIRVSSDAKNIGIDLYASVPESTTVMGDPDRLQQVLWNLLSNAIKFSPENSKVEVKLRASGKKSFIQVTDYGQGIAPEFLPYVFDRFRQADGTTTRKHGGLGLGLSIVKHIVELHGGSVHAESLGDGKGATMTIELPVMEPEVIHQTLAHHSISEGKNLAIRS
jgi:signal transduction histidine kinase